MQNSSNSIAWLAHQLIGLEQDGRPMLDSVITPIKRQEPTGLASQVSTEFNTSIIHSKMNLKVYPVDLIMFYLTPTENNEKAKEMFQRNIFSVTRQLRYSQDAGKLALDLCIFINAFPAHHQEAL